MARESRILLCLCLLMLLSEAAHAGMYRGLEFLEPCQRSDPNLEACLAKSANDFTEHLRNGLPQLGYPEVEPVVLDEVHIVLGAKPDGYKAQFKNVTAKGVSALKITGLRIRITDDELQLQLALAIPKIRAVAKYRSSGKLIIVDANGAGDYWGEYDGVRVKIFIRARPILIDNRKFLRLQQLKMDFSVKNMKMGVENNHDGNKVLQAAINLFIKSNSQYLLTKMKPDLRRKLVQVTSSFVKNLFTQIPMDAWITD